MKKTLFILSAIVLAVSCDKETSTPVAGKPQEIIIAVEGDGISAEVETKTSAVTSLSTAYYAATTGTIGSSETSKYGSTSASVSSGKISTGKYQTATATSYNWYISNCAMTFGQSGSTITADGTAIDAVAGYTAANNTTTPSVTLDHIFARTGTLTISATNSYVISSVTYKLKSKGTNTGTKGTYNIYSKAWSSCTALSEQTITSSSDLYLIPGSYTLTVSGTEKLGDYTHTFSASTDITLVAGKQNNIAVKRTGTGATQIVVTTTLTSWGSTTLSPSI